MFRLNRVIKFSEGTFHMRAVKTHVTKHIKHAGSQDTRYEILTTC